MTARAMIAVAFLLASIAEGEACHRYSIWRYGTPQHCRVAAHHARPVFTARAAFVAPAPALPGQPPSASDIAALRQAMRLALPPELTR